MPVKYRKETASEVKDQVRQEEQRLRVTLDSKGPNTSIRQKRFFLELFLRI
jgi:hypothetical protein